MGPRNVGFGYRKKFVVFLSLITLVSAVPSFSSNERDKGSLPSSIGNVFARIVKSPARKRKILHIMSYHSPWKWTDDQFKGFKDALNGLDIEYKVFQMDTKRKSTREWKEKAGKQARELIEAWRPDLVYASDDNAQEYVTKYYVNKDIPFVVSGVNASPEKYGFLGSRNITGVLEEEHFVQTVKLLKGIVPNVKKIAAVFDDGPTWEGVERRMKQKLHLIPDVEFISWDTVYRFEEFKKKMKDYQTKADAIALLGIFTFKDAHGNNVPYQKVLKWTAENSELPDFSFWEYQSSFGTLCVVSVGGYEHGFAAGKIARGILVEGRSPASYPMKPTVKGEPVISLARAKKLGIEIDARILLSSRVITRFAWEK